MIWHVLGAAPIRDDAIRKASRHLAFYKEQIFIRYYHHNWLTKDGRARYTQHQINAEMAAVRVLARPRPKQVATKSPP